MKKIVCFTLTVLLLLIGVSLSVSAAETADVTVTPSQTTAYRGNTVTFTVRISGCDAARTIGIIPRYDSNVFEYVSGEWLLSGALLTDFSNGVATIAFIDERPFNENVLTFTLKVKSDAKFNASSVACSISIMNGSTSISTNISSASVTVECSHDYSDWSSADESQHSRTCSICGKAERGDHDYTNACDDTCNICEHTRTVTHSFETTWSNDRNGHRHVCLVCGIKTDEEAHLPGPEATETSAQTCTVCGYVIAEKLEHIHQPANEWTSNTDTHWHDCETCSDRVDEAAHTFDNACDTICNVCGSERTAEHSFSSSWRSDATGHRHVCLVCGIKTDEGAHTPGPEATETSAQSCTVCGYVINEMLGHSHQPIDEWKSNTDTHWHDCETCSDRVDEAAHTYDNACDTTCNVCSVERTVEHSFDSLWKSDKTGHWHDCRVCAEKDEVVPHTPDEEATETAPQLCTVCNYEIAPIVGHEHIYTGEWFSNADGHWQTCSCGAAADAAAHQWDEGTVDKEPTATEAGQKTYTCTECMLSKTVEVEMLEVTVTVTVPETDQTPDPNEGGLSKLSIVLSALVIGIIVGVAIGIPLTAYNRKRYYESILDSISDETDQQSEKSEKSEKE